MANVCGSAQVTGEYVKLLYFQFRYGDGLIWLLVAGLALASAWYGRSLLRGRRAKARPAATLADSPPPSSGR